MFRDTECLTHKNIVRKLFIFLHTVPCRIPTQSSLDTVVDDVVEGALHQFPPVKHFFLEVWTKEHIEATLILYTSSIGSDADVTGYDNGGSDGDDDDDGNGTFVENDTHKK